jgi:phage tail sheath gpL-like
VVYSYVTRAELENNNITLTVQVDDFAAGEAVEVSGQATQSDAALATFYAIQKVPGRDSSGHSYLKVTADPGDTKFEADQDVTVVARVAKVWVTVLSKDPGNPGAEKIAWTASKAAAVQAGPGNS